MGAQKSTTKPRRLSDLSFEPGFILEIQLDTSPLRQPLDQEMVLSVLMGIDKRNPWFPPNDGPDDPDPIEVTWVGGSDQFGGKVRCNNERSVIREKHLDAYLRYLQTLAELLLQYLQNFGVIHISVVLELSTLVKTCSVQTKDLATKGGARTKT